MSKRNELMIFIVGGIAVLTTIVWIVWTQKKGRTLQTTFFEKEFSSIVVKSNSYFGRTVEFHLDNGLTLYFSPPVEDRIMIGDSVVKESKTYKYQVYRKNSNGEFEYFSSYEGDDVQ